MKDKLQFLPQKKTLSKKYYFDYLLFKIVFEEIVQYKDRYHFFKFFQLGLKIILFSTVENNMPQLNYTAMFNHENNNKVIVRKTYKSQKHENNSLPCTKHVKLQKIF